MRDILQFHTCHGTGITLSENSSVATRGEDFCNGIAFSAKPVKIGQKVCIELVTNSDWSGAIRIGLTRHDPGRTDPASLPRYACPNLTNQPGNWARALNEKYADNGNRITFYLNSQGQLHYFINKEHKGVFLNNLPTDLTLWVLFDIYGSSTSAKFVQPDEAPVEILARGAEALRAYHTACESGTRPVFRTRLMLVGQNRVGKTSLKNALTGQRHNQSEESTDGIDLSASCSFNLRDRQSWKLALSTGPDRIDEETTSSCSKGGVESLEDEYHRALATNIVQELLYLRKQQEKEEAAMLTEEDRKRSCHKNSVSSVNRKPSKSGSAFGALRSAPSTSSVVSSIASFMSPGNLRDHELLQEVPDSVVCYVTQMITDREGQTTRSGPSLSDAQNGRNITLNIWDFAGQAVYYTTHQVFLSSRAVYLMVFNLCSDLDGLAQETRPPGLDGSQTVSPDCEMTHLDYMDFWLNSIHAHTAQNTRDSIDNVTLSPPIFIVGTHRAGLDEDTVQQEKLAEQKFDRIRQYILGKPYEHHVVPTFYAVENNISDGEDQQILLLRRHIEEVSSRETYMGEQMPIKWLQFEQTVTNLLENGTYFSSKHQICEVAKETGITMTTEFETLLGFYHDLGVIIYYGGAGMLDTTLRNTIILKPQWLIDMFKRVINSKILEQKYQAVSDLWQKLLSRGVLEERLLDVIWADNIPQKPALLGLMEKFDLIAECLPNKSIIGRDSVRLASRSYFVPCRLQRMIDSPQIYTSSEQDVVFYFHFNGFLPDGLFHRLLTRSLRWSQEGGGHDPMIYYRTSRLYVDSEHDFVLEMAPVMLSRLKVTVLRLVDLDDNDESPNESDKKTLSPPTPAACAKVRNFLESALSDLRELWMKRISYRACVPCTCDRECTPHTTTHCKMEECMHFLNLDECLSNKIVCCDHRRVKTGAYRKWFPAPSRTVTQGPILSTSGMFQTSIEASLNSSRANEDDLQLPLWVRSAAKLLNGGSDGQDWLALAKRLEYKKNKIDKMMDELNPGLALMTDWILSSGNTSLSTDILITYLEHMQRDDIVEVIQKGQESEQEPPQVFISYQWDCQDDVNSLRDRLEKAGFSCWMDIGQMGGGDQLYTRIDEGIRNSKVVIACLTPKYIISHLCNKELSLADLLRKPIIPVMYSKVPWPPPGGMALTLSQLVYINMKGVGGHGGSGIHADKEDKYQEILQRVTAHAVAKPRPQLDLSPRSEMPKKSDSCHSEPSLPSDVYDGEGAAESFIPYISDSSISGRTTYTAALHGPQNNTPNTAAIARSEFNPHHGNQVEQVHVTKCAVCVIL